ncbi:MAG: hypothetical protein EXR63_05220 [Dehalococcoidia bacterium]|nr:hypothetical protein [Dehalococcoidia bacterium]
MALQRPEERLQWRCLEVGALDGQRRGELGVVGRMAHAERRTGRCQQRDEVRERPRVDHHAGLARAVAGGADELDKRRGARLERPVERAREHGHGVEHAFELAHAVVRPARAMPARSTDGASASSSALSDSVSRGDLKSCDTARRRAVNNSADEAGATDG